MTLSESHNAPWTRKHDSPSVPLIAQAPTIAYPQSLADLIALVQSRQAGQYFKAAGSHWALSSAAISDNVFIETNDPNNIFPAMGRTLYDVVPGCLSESFLDVLHSAPPRISRRRQWFPSGALLLRSRRSRQTDLSTLCRTRLR